MFLRGPPKWVGCPAGLKPLTKRCPQRTDTPCVPAGCRKSFFCEKGDQVSFVRMPVLRLLEEGIECLVENPHRGLPEIWDQGP